MIKILNNSVIAIISILFLISCDNSKENNNSDSSNKTETVRFNIGTTF